MTECTLKNCHRELSANCQKVTGFCSLLHLQWYNSGNPKFMEIED